jgi:TusA-related sulfurtransferase
MKNDNNIIDLLGLKCPLPILRANRIIKNYKKGDIIEFLVNDEAAPDDFKAFCETKKFQLLSISKNENIKIKIKI